jgi:tRNA pseudouridine synthase 10
LEDFVRLVTETSKDYEFETFLIGTKVDSEVMEAEEDLWGRLEVETQEPIKGELNREIGKLLEQRLEKTVDFNNPHLTFVVDTRYNNIETTIKPLYVYGRYRKLKRGIPQTKWFCRKCRGYGCEYCNNTGKMYETSVEELVGASLLEAAQGESHSFHGMGREDIDALMLGNGRPFVLEVSGPKKRTLELEKILEKINQDNKETIEIEGFKYSDLTTVRRIKSERSRKTYRVGIEFGSEPDKEKVFKVANNFRNLQIQQQTPKRVSHRRANLKRKRTVHAFEIMDLAGKSATIEIIGESGLYIKELIHGDDGRTNPSFSSELGIDCTVKCLDVVHIWDEDQTGDE